MNLAHWWHRHEARAAAAFVDEDGEIHDPAEAVDDWFDSHTGTTAVVGLDDPGRDAAIAALGE